MLALQERWVQWSSPALLTPSQSFHQILGPVLWSLQQMREIQVQISANPQLHLKPLYLTSNNWPLGSFCHSRSALGNTVLYLHPFLSFLLTQHWLWYARHCVSNGKRRRTSPWNRGTHKFLQFQIVCLLLHIKVKTLLFSPNVKNFAVFHNCSHLGLQFHLNSMLLPRTK